MKRQSRRPIYNALIAALMCFIIFPVLPSALYAQAALKQAIERELRSPLFDHTVAGIEISDIATGKVLYARNADLLLRPASNAKLFTSAAALLTLPGGTHFETSAFYRQTHGGRTELWIKGGGDPLFSSKDIQKIVESIPAHGIQTIDAVYLDQTLFDTTYYGEGWMWDDEWSEFTPYLSAFALDGNNFTVNVRGGSPPTVQLDPPSENIKMRFDERADNFDVMRIPHSSTIVVHGSPRRGRNERETVSMWRPQDVFLERVLAELKSAGLLVSGDTEHGFGTLPENCTSITTIRRSLDEVLTVMNKESNNLCAETVLKQLAVYAGPRHKGSTETGLEIMQRALGAAGVRSSELSLVDGSGISFYNLVTPAALGKTLRYMAKSSAFERYAASLAVGGNDGTLARRFRSVPDDVVIGKTGTIRGVSALSGYILPRKGMRLAFVVFIQNFSGSHAPYRSVQDRIVEACLRYARKNSR